MAGDRNIVAILISLKVTNKMTFYLMVSEDGTIHRLGPEADANSKMVLKIGRIATEVFTGLRGRVTPALVQCIGSFGDPAPVGEICQLTVVFKEAGGEELKSYWLYGSESQGPSPAVCDFVSAALETTDPWYQQQGLP